MSHHQATSLVDAPFQSRVPAEPADLERLMTRAAEGDEDAWTTLVQRFGARLRSVARAHRLGAQDAEDVVQKTWLELLTHIRQVRDPNRVGAWLRTTARRESLNVSTASRREVPIDQEALARLPVAAEDACRVEAAERSAALAGALHRLGARQQQLMGMLLDDSMPSYTHISATLDMPIGSIGPTRARCLHRLRTDQALMRAIGDDLL